jgi:hypothetical protein
LYSTKYYDGDQIKKDEMRGAYMSIMHRKEGNAYKVLVGKAGGKMPLEGLGIATGYGLRVGWPGFDSLHCKTFLDSFQTDSEAYPANAYQRSFPAGKSAGA